FNKLLDNSETKNGVVERLTNQYQNMDFWEFVEKIYYKVYYDFEKKIIGIIFKKRLDEFRKYLDMFDFDRTLLVDLSNEIFKSKDCVIIVGMILLCKEKVMVNCRTPFELVLRDTDVFSVVQTIKNNSTPCDKIYY